MQIAFYETSPDFTFGFYSISTKRKKYPQKILPYSEKWGII
ncbi:hypothetical protein RUMCAL_02564 [Ruminococcus callidus ATCC 27760]|uniref:Uncharacterized protein n=1 Tax=Ruminococcus callidus ATCC 27760 TaxID=411473 RepID=U2KH80_9FIRM|nr:hypothetical protein RUMCAL_02564 [Ruminococcus callidus ATCC 27760]